jgi:hypothetical protein
MLELAHSFECPGEPCYQIEPSGRVRPLSGTTKGWIYPKPAEPLRLYRIKFTMESTTTYIAPSTWYDKSVYSLRACKHHAEGNIAEFMTGANFAKNANVASLTYACELLPDET